MPKSTLGVAIIGAGSMGRAHAARYANVQGAKLRIIVDMDDDRARTLQEEVGIPERATDYREVLKRDDIDIVDICLPTWLHEDVAVEAAQAGKHVLVEKPMALSVESAQRMTEAANQSGVLLMVAQCRRYSNDWLKVRELVQAGVLGRPVIWRTVRAVRVGEGWFVKKGRGDGPLLDGAIHDYDFARYTFGEAQSAMASTMIFREDATVADTGTAIVKFRSGDEMVVSWSWGLPPGARGGAMHDIIGPKGALFFDRNARANFADLPPLDPGYGAIVVDRGRAGAEQYPYLVNDMYLDEIQAFVDAIREGRPSPVDGDEAMKGVAIGRAVLEAGETGQVVWV